MKNYIVQYTLANPDFGEWETEEVKATNKLEAAREVIDTYGHQFRVRIGEVKEREKTLNPNPNPTTPCKSATALRSASL